jgi:hypothetical protein
MAAMVGNETSSAEIAATIWISEMTEISTEMTARVLS